ncbi:MAG: hypothetical protein AB7F43_01935 [Bacteriovoracia bacterium]
MGDRDLKDLIKKVSTLELWMELARRFDIRYGKVQMVFHAGKPSKYMDVDTRLDLEQENLVSQN